jgi:hypothetical protein
VGHSLVQLQVLGKMVPVGLQRQPVQVWPNGQVGEQQLSDAAAQT